MELKDFLATKPTDETPLSTLKLIGLDPGSEDLVRVEIDDALDPQIQAVKNYKHLSSYASWTSAISAIGSTPTILKIDETPTISSGGDLPKTLFLDYSGGYGLNIASGQIITGTMPVNAPMSRIWTGAGQYRIKETAGANVFYGVWCMPDGTVSEQVITAAMSQMMRYWLFLNNGGRLVLPMGSYTLDHDWVHQIGYLEGSGNNPNITGGTQIRRIAGGSGQPAAISFLAGGRDMTIRNMVVRTEEATGVPFLAYSSEESPQTIDGIRFENVTAEGGSESLRIFHDHANKNWQVHNIHIDSLCDFFGATVANIRCDSVNAGGYCAANLRPAPNGTAGEFKGESFAKWHFERNGIGVVPENMSGSPSAAIKFTFTSSDVNTSTDQITKTAHGLSTGDSIYLSNSGGALPTGLSTAVKYWVRVVDVNTFTLHQTPGWAHSGTPVVDITGGGSGTNTLWSTRPNPVATPNQPAYSFSIEGPFSEGLIISGLARDEGTPWLLKVAEGLTANYSAPIELYGVHTQAQCEFGSNVMVNLYGGFFPADSFKDKAGVTTIINNFGARPYTYGVGGPHNNYGGYAVPSPYRLDDFQGNSYFATYINPYNGAEFATNANDTAIARWRVHNRESSNALAVALMRKSTVLAGHFEFVPTMDGVSDSQSGMGVRGAWSYKGRSLNSRSDTVDQGTSGKAIIDLRLGDEFTIIPNADREFEIINFNSGMTQYFTVVIETSGTTSYDLTFKPSHFDCLGSFRTGTVSGVKTTLLFRSNGSLATEVGTRAGAIWTPSNERSVIAFMLPKTYGQSDGTNITTDWKDLSRFRQDWTVTGTPTYETNEQNGQPAIKIGDDSNDNFNLPDWSGKTELAMYKIMKIDNYTPPAGDLIGPVVGSDYDTYVYNDNKVYSSFATSARKVTPAAATTIDESTYHILYQHSRPGWFKLRQTNNTDDTVEINTTTNTVSISSAPKIGYNGSAYAKHSLLGVIVLDKVPDLALDERIRDFIRREWALGIN